MKKPMPSVADAAPGQRTFHLHARFTPKGPKKADFAVFQEFWLSARQHILEKENAKLALHRAALESVHPRPAKSPSKRAIKAGVASGDKVMAALYQEITAMDQEITALDLEASIFDRGDAARVALEDLMELALTGNAEAATSLVALAQDAAIFLHEVEKAQPEVMGRIARSQGIWPVLAWAEAGWEEKARKRITDLRLGEYLCIFKVRFRQARGGDAHLPPRLWAKATVRTIEDCRLRIMVSGGLMDKMGSKEDFHDFRDQSGWRFGPSPNWTVQASKLHPFSTQSLPEWKAVIRQMIREELPNFHQHKDWANQRRRGEAHGNDSPGKIRNAILDDIVSALKHIAPEPSC